MQGSAAFFAPLTRIVPSSGSPPRMTSLSISVSPGSSKAWVIEPLGDQSLVKFHSSGERPKRWLIGRARPTGESDAYKNARVGTGTLARPGRATLDWGFADSLTRLCP